jgi:hypothetical protein
MKTLSVWTATLVSLAIFGLTGYASSPGCPAHLPAGTIIRLFPDEKLVANVTSGPVIFTISSDVRFFPNRPPLLSRGSKVLGRVVESRQAGRLWGKAQMHILLTSILTADYCEYPIDAKILEAGRYTIRKDVVIGRGHAGRDAFLLLFPPTTAYQLMRIPARGPRLVIDSEMPVVLKLLEPVELGQSSDARQAAVVPSLKNEVDRLEARLDQIEQAVSVKVPDSTLRRDATGCPADNLKTRTTPIIEPQGIRRPIRNMTPYYVRLYMKGTPVAVLAPCYGPSMVLMPPSGFKLVAIADLPIEGGQQQLELQIIPNLNGNGWDVVRNSQEAAPVRADVQRTAHSDP